MSSFLYYPRNTRGMSSLYKRTSISGKSVPPYRDRKGNSFPFLLSYSFYVTVSHGWCKLTNPVTLTLFLQCLRHINVSTTFLVTILTTTRSKETRSFTEVGNIYMTNGPYVTSYMINESSQTEVLQ